MSSISREDFDDAVNRVLEGFSGFTKLNEYQRVVAYFIQRRDATESRWSSNLFLNYADNSVSWATVTIHCAR